MYSTIKDAIDNATLTVYESVLWAKLESDAQTTASYKVSDNDYEDGYIPIGLYVVPEEHVGDGLRRFMSLKYMSTSNPDNGTINSATMYWGTYGTDTSLPNLSQVVKYNVVSGTISIKATSKRNSSIFGTKEVVVKKMTTAESSTDYACLPTDKFTTGIGDPLNPNLHYYYQDTNSSGANYNTNYAAKMCPAPFLADGSQNLRYKSVAITSTNALSDFGGKANTSTLVNNYTSDDPDWRTNNAIANQHTGSYSPAACCCQRYNPDGFTQFQWYLPACGEFGYVCVFQNRINVRLSRLRANYVEYVLAASLPASHFWLSSECSANCARSIDFSDGTVINYYGKSYAFCVLGFLSA